MLVKNGESENEGLVVALNDNDLTYEQPFSVQIIRFKKYLIKDDEFPYYKLTNI
jgi:hypothetical protein